MKISILKISLTLCQQKFSWLRIMTWQLIEVYRTFILQFISRRIKISELFLNCIENHNIIMHEKQFPSVNLRINRRKYFRNINILSYLIQFLSMDKKFTDFELKWLHQPKEYKITPEKIQITTEPNTDYWQRTYYGFQNDKAPILYAQLNFDFTFQARNTFKLFKLYDQSGLIIYQDSDNWCKIDIQYRNQNTFWLGSVVTNLGYSDWATTDIPSSVNQIYYRLSRRGQDFLIQYSYDGKQYQQMRIFHMHKPIEAARVGIYACSPLNSSHQTQFYDLTIKQSTWQAYKSPEQLSTKQ